MASRLLNDHEVLDLLQRHPDIQQLVTQHEALYVGPNHTLNWDQVAAAQVDIPSWYPIPPRGKHVADDTYGDVILFPDAQGVLRYVATDNSSLVNEIDKPVYTSDPQYFQNFLDILTRIGEHVPTIPQIDLGLGAVAVIGVVVLFFLYGRR